MLSASPDELRFPGGPQSGAWPRRFGSYELLEEIGRGGMGVVYRARPLRQDGIVALKILPGAIFGDPQFIRRFRAEVNAAALLKHPHIVGIHEVGEHDGHPFYTMDYVDGQNLATRLAQRRYSAPEAASLLATLTRAVQFAHNQGVLHRDIKPSNILVDRAGQPYLADFGLAKQINSDADLTLTGQTLGSPNYIPPEQVSADHGKIGAASDVYALGAVLYHVLTGRPPHVADTIHDTLEAVLRHDPIPPRLLHPKLPRDLETICLKCLAKEPAQRYATAQDLADDLARFSRHENIRARPIGLAVRLRKWIRRRPALTVSGAALLIGAGVLAFLGGYHHLRLRQERDRAVASEQLAAHTVTQLEFHAALGQFENDRCLNGLAGLAKLIRRDPGHRDAAARLASALTYRAFPLLSAPPMGHPAELAEAHFTPDGRTIVSAGADGKIRFWSVETGQRLPMVFSVDGPIRSLSLSADGKKLMAAQSNGDLTVASLDQGQSQIRLANAKSPVLFARFNDEGTLALAACADRTVHVWRVPSGEEAIAPIPHHDTVTVATFNPRGGTILTGSLDGRMRVWSLEDGRPLGELISTFRPLNQAVFDETGVRIASASGDHRPLIWSAASGKLNKDFPRLSAALTAIAFSPDGMRLAAGTQDGTWQIGDVTSRQSLSRLVDAPGGIVSLRFSPEGERIMVVSSDRTVQIFDSQNGAPLLEPIPHPALPRSAEFHPNGDRLLTAAGTNVCVWDIVRVMKPSLVAAHTGDASSLRFSPDSTKILAGCTDGTARLFVLSTGQPLGLVMPHTPNIALTSVDFSADGRKVATASADHTARVWDAETGAPLTPPLPHDQRVLHAAFHPTRNRLVTAAGDGAVVFWDLDQGGLELARLRHPCAVHWAEFSPDGKQVVTAGQDGQVRFWSAETGRQETNMWAHAGAVSAAVFSTDGRWLLTGSEDGSLILGSADGRSHRRGYEHAAPVTGACFSGDSHQALTSSADGVLQLWSIDEKPMASTIRFRRMVSGVALLPGAQAGFAIVNREYVAPWSLQAGTVAGEWWRHWGTVHALALSPDGRWAATGGAKSTGIRIRQLPPNSLPAPAWLARLAEALAGSRVLENGSSLVVPPGELWEVQQEMQKPTKNDEWNAWGRWLVDLSDQRTVAWSTSITRLDLARSCLADASSYLHREAARFAPDQPRVLAQLAIDLLRMGNRARFRKEAQLLIRVARQRAPDDPEIERRRQEVETAHTPPP